MQELLPPEIAAPFARYVHGVLVPEGYRLILTSGQLGLSADGSVPDDVGGQARICFGNIDAILRAGGATRADVIRLIRESTGRT